MARIDRPADGFSLNYASISDPLLSKNDGNGWAGTDTEPGAEARGNGLPEEGSTTGLAIGFDTWQSATIKGVQDVVGISVRVANALVVQFPVPLAKGNAFTPEMRNPGTQGNAYIYNEAPYRNLPSSDANYNNSMQTGRQNPNRNDASGLTNPSLASWGLLRWESFKVSIDENAKLEMFWKGKQITPDGGLQTAFSPQAGRIILGGRTGSANENHHIDNITLTTTATTDARINSISVNANAKVIIQFVGQLQSTGDLNEPFANVSNATSPLEVDPTLASRFYRAIP